MTNINDNFKSWFGDSKVTNNGEPIVVYHGSRDKFDSFNPNKTNWGDVSQGFVFFLNDKDYARDYGREIYQCYLKMENPLYINFESSYVNDAISYWDFYYKDIRKQYDAGNYDGIIIQNKDKTENPLVMYLVPNGNQIKAVANNGNWSDSNNIYESLSKVLNELDDNLPDDLLDLNFDVDFSKYDIDFNDEEPKQDQYDPKANWVVADETKLNDNFWSWFKNSYAVKDGRPVVLYHGTPSDNITEFDNSRNASTSGRSVWGRGGFYFTTQESTAKEYGKHIIPVFLSIQKPFISGLSTLKLDVMFKLMYKREPNQENDDLQLDYLESKLKYPADLLQTLTNPNEKWGYSLEEIMEANGYDSIIDGHVFVALYPNQIKSVDNNGEWSTNSNNIYESEEEKENKFNDSFWKWFGNSKVVDKNGFPLVVYHGTDAEFAEFSKPYGFSGDYFTDNEEVAKYFSTYGFNPSNARVLKVYLKIEKPYYINVDGKTWQELQQMGTITDAIKRVKNSSNYDGIIITDIREGTSGNQPPATDYITFKPNQIKSVDNNGNWSNSNNIYENKNKDTKFKRWFGNSKVTDKKGNPLIVYHGTTKTFHDFNMNNGTNISASWFTNKKSVASVFSRSHKILSNGVLINKIKGIKTFAEFKKFAKQYANMRNIKIVPHELGYGDDKQVQTDDNGNVMYVMEYTNSLNTTDWDLLGTKISELEYQHPRRKGITSLVKDYILGELINLEDVKETDGGVYPCYLSFQNPLIVDAQKNMYYNIPYNGRTDYNTESIVTEAQKQGYDSVIIKNVRECEAGYLVDDYIALNPNQIKSVENNGDWSNSNNIYETLNSLLEEFLNDTTK